MSYKKGFTLTELIVAMIILGSLTAMVVPSYNSYIQQAEIQAATTNLQVIALAEKNYYFINKSYCTTSCGYGIAQLNSSLSLNITDSNYIYTCYPFVSGNGQSSFTCQVRSPMGNRINGYLYLTYDGTRPPSATNPQGTNS